MKKIIVLAVLLFTAQLFGCAGQTEEADEPAAGKFQNNAPAISSETDDSQHSMPETEVLPQPAPETELSDAVTADGYYSAATGISSADVENYAVKIRQQFLDHDWLALSSEISYPITLSEVTYNNSEDFLDASESFADNLDETFFSSLEAENCREMFCSWEGIMLGEAGQVWIAEVSQELKITGINGMLIN